MRRGGCEALHSDPVPGRRRGLAGVSAGDPGDFSAAGDIPGVRGAEVFPNCVDRENRYHVLIRLDMDPAALAAYDVSPMHHRWKDRFGPLLEKKAIFDFEE